MFNEFSAEFIVITNSYNSWCDAQPDRDAGSVIQDPAEPGTTHPSLGWIEFDVRGVHHRRRDSVDIVYHLQRVFDVVDALDDKTRSRFAALVKQAGGSALMSNRPSRRIAYADFRYVLA